MRIEKTDHRERIWTALQEATGERTTSKALDVAARYYLTMAGNSRAFPTGRVEELLELAEEQGTVTPDEIVELLDVDELPVERDVDVDVGRD